MKKHIFPVALIAAMIAVASYAAVVIYTATIANETSLAYSRAFVVDLNAVGAHEVSAQVSYSSASTPAVNFGDGQVSTGNVTVVTNAALSTAAATNQITVVSNTGSRSATITTQGRVLREGIDWVVGINASSTAISLATALDGVNGINASALGAVVFATAATPGSLGNSFALVSSTPTALTVATPFFRGGQDNAVLRYSNLPNGAVVSLTQGQQWTQGGTAALTATSIASAINAAPGLGSALSATAIGAIVYTTSTANGLATRYTVFTSTQPALRISSPFTTQEPTATGSLTNGINPAFTLGQPAFTIPNHRLTLAMPVVYSTSNGLIGGFTSGTTYYAAPLSSDLVALATSSGNALGGTYIVPTSSTTQVVAHVYTLSPLGNTGTAGFYWQVSNDNINWLDLTISSVTISLSAAPASAGWDMGPINFQFLRLNVQAPTTGGIKLKADINAH